MKKLFFIIILFPLQHFCQDYFYSGYYIDKQGNKVEGLIEFENKYNTPDKFNFKSNETSEIKELNVYNVSEIVVTGKVSYKVFETAYDTSINTKYFSNDNSLEPKLKFEKLFLKKLNDGNLLLYTYIKDDIISFFVSEKSKQDIEYLVFKKNINENYITKENNKFREILYRRASCKEKKLEDFLKIKYERESLLDCVDKVNKCDNSYINYDSIIKENNKLDFNYSVFLGARYNTYSIDLAGVGIIFDESGNFFSPSLGIEAEVVLPYNRKRFSFFSRVELQRYQIDDQFRDTTFSSIYIVSNDLEISTLNLDVLLGARMKFLKSVKNNFGIELGLIGSHVFDDLKFNIRVLQDETVVGTSNDIFLTSTNINLFMGFFVELTKKINLTFNYFNSRNYLSGEYPRAKFNNSSFNVNLSYKF